MALPAGVTTATVTAGVPVTHTGAPVKAFVSIEPSVFLVHTATGTPLVDFLEELSINEGVAGQFTLPHTDQAGFQDENGNSYTNWYYTARVSYSTPSKAKTKAPKIKVFQLATGQVTVDLDALPGGAPALPYTAPIATVTSFGGRTGPITLQEGDLPERLTEEELSATILDTGKTVRLAAFDRFSTKPNGTFPTARPDSGQVWKETQNTAPGAALQIISGKLTNTVTAAGAGAGYAEIDMTAPVTRVGGKFVLNPGGDNGGGTYDYGGIEIGVWKEPISSNFPTIPNSPCHLVVYPEYWNFGVWDRDGGGMLQSIKTVFFAAPLATDGTTVHTIDVRFDGATAYLTLPDGTTDTITDARILSRAGNWAQWEIYQQDAAVHTKAAWTEVWADTAPYTMQAKNAAATVVPSSYANHFSTTSTDAIGTVANVAVKSTWNLAANYPASGKLFVTATFNVTGVTGTLLGMVNNVGAQRLAVSGYTGPVTIRALLTGTPGAAVTLSPQAWLLSGAGNAQFGGEYGIATISAVPIT
jgi:hypothetical protein